MSGLRGPPVLPPDRAPSLEVEVEHYPIKRRWRRHLRCACGRYLDRCTEYWASLARSR